MRNVFLDFDGTLINSQKRLYLLFQYLVNESQLSFDAYWEQKKNKINHQTILSTRFNYAPDKINSFTKNWMSLIEAKEWLEHDVPFSGVTEFLQKLKQHSILHLVTARQSVAMVNLQLSKFGWTGFFENVFVTEQKKEKAEMIRGQVNTKASDYFIGDTGKDILAGKELGVRTVAVLSGFLNKEKLVEYAPDQIIDNITQLKLEQHE